MFYATHRGLAQALIPRNSHLPGLHILATSILIRALLVDGGTRAGTGATAVRAFRYSNAMRVCTLHEGVQEEEVPVTALLLDESLMGRIIPLDEPVRIINKRALERGQRFDG